MTLINTEYTSNYGNFNNSYNLKKQYWSKIGLMGTLNSR